MENKLSNSNIFCVLKAICRFKTSNYYLIIGFIILGLTQIFDVKAQDDLDNILDGMEAKEKATKTEYTTAAFKASRLIQLQTPEMLAHKTLEFRIAHRFGAMNKGVDDLFGLDKVSARFGFEYGATPWLTLGVGRSGSYLRSYDMSAKIQLLRQSTGKTNMPISLLYYANMAIRTDEFNTPSLYNTSHRLFYAQQLTITRKFSENLSGFTNFISLTLLHAQIYKPIKITTYNIFGQVNGKIATKKLQYFSMVRQNYLLNLPCITYA